jgi:hypothetical protein
MSRVILIAAALTAFLSACSQQAATDLPSGMIVMFDGQCPKGWTRYDTLDGRFPRGSTQPGASGGQEEHVHSFDITARTSKDGAHVHMLAMGNNVEVDPGFFGHIGIHKGYLQAFEEGGRDRKKAARARAVTDEDGAHDHLISVQGDSESSSNLPPFLEVVFCRKD